MTEHKDDIAIKVENLTKTFKVPVERSSGIKQKIINVLKGRKGYREFTPLRDISFEIKKGEFFGIVGRNGSGKSTLLKSIAGIYTIESGKVHVNGTLVPFIELGVGFNPELTGRENIYLNGALLGFSNKEMAGMYDEIVDFAELHDFMEERLKNYSSGMQVRLAFSIAIRAKGDILLLDEVLAVGDEEFQRKSNDFFDKIKKDKTKTVILVTHSMGSVRKYCNKALMLDKGEIVAIGSPGDVSNQYSLENARSIATEHEESSKDKLNKDSIIRGLEVELSPEKQIKQDDELKIKISYNVSSNIATRIKVSIEDIDRRTPVFAADSPVLHTQDVTTTLCVKFDCLNDINMKISVSVRDKSYGMLYFLSDERSPILSLKRTDYPSPTKTTWALLFSRGEWRE